MNISRRNFVIALVALIASPALAHRGLKRHKHPHGLLKPLRRSGKARRRRVRRHVLWRTVRGRRVLAMPLALAVGWELLLDNEVVVVKQVHAHKVIVEHKNGKTQELDIVSEDSEQNTQELEGSEY